MPPSRVVKLLAHMCDRRVRGLEDLWPHLQFIPNETPGQDRASLEHFTALFSVRLQRYLAGKGHPDNWREALADGEWEAHASDEAFRARLLLRAMSDSTLLPSESVWHLTVRPFLVLCSCAGPDPDQFHVATKITRSARTRVEMVEVDGELVPIDVGVAEAGAQAVEAGAQTVEAGAQAAEAGAQAAEADAEVAEAGAKPKPIGWHTCARTADVLIGPAEVHMVVDQDRFNRWIHGSLVANVDYNAL